MVISQVHTCPAGSWQKEGIWRRGGRRRPASHDPPVDHTEAEPQSISSILRAPIPHEGGASHPRAQGNGGESLGVLSRVSVKGTVKANPHQPTLFKSLLLFWSEVVLYSSAYLKNPIGVHVKRHLDLGNPSGHWRESIQLKLTQHSVILGQRALPLEHLDKHSGLVVGECREHLSLLGGYGSASVDELCHHSSGSLYKQ